VLRCPPPHAHIRSPPQEQVGRCLPMGPHTGLPACVSSGCLSPSVPAPLSLARTRARAIAPYHHPCFPAGCGAAWNRSVRLPATTAPATVCAPGLKPRWPELPSCLCWCAPSPPPPLSRARPHAPAPHVPQPRLRLPCYCAPAARVVYGARPAIGLCCHSAPTPPPSSPSPSPHCSSHPRAAHASALTVAANHRVSRTCTRLWPRAVVAAPHPTHAHPRLLAARGRQSCHWHAQRMLSLRRGSCGGHAEAVARVAVAR
jgi:hypothetical protein